MPASTAGCSWASRPRASIAGRSVRRASRNSRTCHSMLPRPRPRKPAFAPACAVGRKFRQTLREWFGRPPAALRRIRDKTRREAGALSVRLPYRPPYDWDAMLSFLSARAIPGVEIVAGDSYRRTIAIGKNSGVISVEPADKNRIDVRVRFPDMAALPSIIARVRRVFDLAADPDTIRAHLALDPAL